MSEINREGIIKKLSWYCFICNYYEEKGKGTLCGQKLQKVKGNIIIEKESDDCIFCRNSASEKGKPSRIGLKSSIFKPLGLTDKQCANWGPHQLFIYLFYPKLNWQPPPIPDYDNYGEPVEKEKARQTIHHINNDHFDNRKDNLTWNLSSDHTRNGQLTKKIKNLKIEDAKRCAKELGIKIPKKKMDRR